MRNTIILAFAGEIGGIVIGLVLGVLTLSERRRSGLPRGSTSISFEEPR